MQDKFLSRTQVAAMLGVSAQTITQWERKNQGPHCIRAGKSVFYPKDAVLEFIDNNPQYKNADNEYQRVHHGTNVNT